MSGGGEALRLLLSASAHARPDDLSRLVAQAGRRLGAETTVVYVVDYDQLVLCPMLPGVDDASREPITVEGTLGGRAYSTVMLVEARHGASTTLWFPLLDGAERLGVVEIVFSGLIAVDERLRSDCAHLVTLIGELSTTRAMYGDGIESSRRRMPMSTATELQRMLLPPLSFATPELSIAGALVPAYEVAGDCYDYAAGAQTAHVAILDAMGHEMGATVLAAVAISAYRNARRTGLDLVHTAISIDRWISNQFDAEQFVTGILAELDLRTGVWTWITCGHPPALLLRGGQVVKVLEQTINPPLGLLADAIVEPATERLEPGDRLVLHSDGVTEARAADGQLFGADRLADFVSRFAFDGLPAAETLRRLTHAILDHQHGRLDDDATVVLLEWRGAAPLSGDPASAGAAHRAGDDGGGEGQAGDDEEHEQAFDDEADGPDHHPHQHHHQQ